MKKNILFVDDEPNVLGGIRRMLRPLHEEWTTEFAEGGPQALAVLEKKSFDVIVSDMRMPGMTGAQLLEQVRERFPGMVRIILTGQCDEESGLRAFRVAHQMLYKPCDAETLRSTVARTCTLSELLANKTLQAVVMRQGSIPSAPTLYTDVIAEMDSPAPSLERIASIISKDVAMATKILHVVNSSFFGVKHEIGTILQAVKLLGLETIRLLILSVGIFSSFKNSAHPRLSLESLQKHSQATSALAKAIAKSEAASPREVEQATMAGMVHDVGKLVLLDSGAKAYANIVDQALSSGRPQWEIEREVFGASHAEVGACLLGLWGLPMPIVEAVAWHHRPSDCPAQSFGPLTAVHVANALATDNVLTEAPRVDRAYLERLKLLERLPHWGKLSQTPTPEDDKK
jgi:HD-like signal output (HDOD) protein